MELPLKLSDQMNVNESSSREQNQNFQRDLFSASRLQIYRKRSRIMILQKINLKKVALKAIEEKKDFGLTKEDLGTISEQEIHEKLDQSTKFGQNWAKVHLIGPLWIQYDLKISDIKMTFEDDISDDEGLGNKRKSQETSNQQSLSTLARIDSESEYKPSESEDKDLVRMAIGNDGMVADIQIDEMPKNIRKFENVQISKDSKEVKEKITFDVVLEISIRLVLHNNQQIW